MKKWVGVFTTQNRSVRYIMQIGENMLGNILSKVLTLCGFFMFILISFVSFRSTMPIFSSKLVLVVEILATLVVLVLISFLVNRYLTEKQFIIFLITVSFGIRILWITFINTVPSSDFSLMYGSAQQAVKGDFSFVSTGYFSSWVYQLGFTYYEAFLIKIFGNHLFVLKLINIFFSIGTSLFIYLFSKRTFNEFTARTAALLYGLYIPNVIYSSVLTNQYISTFMFLGGLYFLAVRGDSAKFNWLLGGLMLGIGNIFRPAGSFFLLGICVFIFIYKILPLRKKESFNYTKKLIGILLVYFLVQQIVSLGLVHSGLANKPLSNQEPYWKFAVGLNYNSNGSWNLKDQDYVSKFKLGTERNKAELSLVKERLQNKQQVVKLFINKFVTFWGAPDDSTYWSLENLNKANLQNQLMKYERLMYIAACLLAIGTIALYKKKNEAFPLLYILLGGYAAIHMIVEIQTRYRFDILPVLFILVGYGVYVIQQRLQNIITKKSN